MKTLHCRCSGWRGFVCIIWNESQNGWSLLLSCQEQYVELFTTYANVVKILTPSLKTSLGNMAKYGFLKKIYFCPANTSKCSRRRWQFWDIIFVQQYKKPGPYIGWPFGLNNFQLCEENKKKINKIKQKVGVDQKYFKHFPR